MVINDLPLHPHDVSSITVYPGRYGGAPSPADPDFRRSQAINVSKHPIQLWAGLAVLLALIAALVITLITSADHTDPPAHASASGSSAPNTSTGKSTPTSKSNTNSGPAADAPRRSDDDPLVLGSPDAPVTMIEFADFRCPYCAQFTRDTEPELIKRYVDTGIVRIEWRDSPIFGEQSEYAARAGRAAAAQGRFWEFVTAVMGAAPETGHANLDTAALLDFARKAGVTDLERFRADLDSDRFDSEIKADSELAQQLFIPTTPAFWINGTPILGSQPLQVYVDVIEGSRPQ